MQPQESTPKTTGNLFIVSGPSGSGKTSLCRRLLAEMENIQFSVSYTTRQPRQNEKEGLDYFFVPMSRFHQMQLEGRVLEWANVYGNLYATSRDYVDATLARGIDVLLDIDVQGAEQVKHSLPAAIATLVFPPSGRLLKERLEQRASDRVEIIRERLKIARGELMCYRKFDYVIVNEELDFAAKELIAIVRGQRCRSHRRSVIAEQIISSYETVARNPSEDDSGEKN